LLWFHQAGNKSRLAHRTFGIRQWLKTNELAISSITAARFSYGCALPGLRFTRACASRITQNSLRLASATR
jgi:hypothetical protein